MIKVYRKNPPKNFSQKIPLKKFRPKKSSKKILSKKSSQKIPPKKIRQKSPPEKSSRKIPKKILKKFQKNSIKFFKKWLQTSHLEVEILFELVSHIFWAMRRLYSFWSFLTLMKKLMLKKRMLISTNTKLKSGKH